MGISLGHIVILVIVLLIFGPKKLSSLGHQLGASLGKLRKQIDDISEDSGLQSVRESLHNAKDDITKFKSEINPLTNMDAAKVTKDQENIAENSKDTSTSGVETNKETADDTKSIKS